MCTRAEGSLRGRVGEELFVEMRGTLTATSSHVVREQKSNNTQDENDNDVHHLEFLVLLLVSNSACEITNTMTL